jgi:anti-sigma B factor antagonist
VKNQPHDPTTPIEKERSVTEQATALTCNVSESPDGSAIVAIGGEIDVATSPEVRRALHALVDEGATSIRLDLAATTFIDSTGLGVLVGVLKRMRERDPDAEVVIIGLASPVRKVFDITGLTDVFSVDQ